MKPIARLRNNRTVDIYAASSLAITLEKYSNKNILDTMLCRPHFLLLV